MKAERDGVLPWGSSGKMFDEHDLLILGENNYQPFPREEDGVDWAMRGTERGIKIIIANFNDAFFIKILTDYPTSDYIPKTCIVNTVDEAVRKAQHMENNIESNYLRR